jgi:hypothetical protein
MFNKKVKFLDSTISFWFYPKQFKSGTIGIKFFENAHLCYVKIMVKFGHIQISFRRIDEC